MKKSIIAIIVLVPALWLFWRVGLPDSSHAATEIDFNRDIRPILNQNCLACHGGVKQAGGFSMLFPEEALQPTDSGKPALIPGDAEASELFRRIVHHDSELRMPLDAEPLSTEETNIIRRWIENGAEWSDHWAYIAPIKPELPQVKQAQWPLNEIDRFVLARLEQKNMRPSPRADCGTLLRRVSLDLTGLPPEPEDVLLFCADDSDAAYEAAVDKLLASPRFGERWAAMWLDLARYADSMGYESDGHRTIWRYREWVIKAFNDDMPFDQFTMEQLAGDLLDDPDEWQVIATAFHRNTMTNNEGGTDDEEFRIAAVMDRVNTTWEVWQATTMSCVQCHSHTYDPFRHEEYFQAMAFFNNTEDADRADEYPVLHGYSYSQLEKRENLQAQIDSLINLQNRPSGELFQQVSLGPENSPRPDRTPDPSTQTALNKSESPRKPEPHALLLTLQQELEAITPVSTPVMRELPEEQRRTTRFFEGGNWLAQTHEVQAGVPGSMPPMPEGAPDNRLGLAMWLVSTENPLTARAMVNRFWYQLFGKGLVETIEDFGTQGDKPTHPELLDWLAMHFMHDLEWSVKGLLRHIVLSETYRQQSHVTREHLQRDARNELLARGPRFRLSAEQVRDQALAASGLLSFDMYGPSVMPPQPEGIWRNPYSGLRWTTSEGEDRYRRALYTYIRRTAPYPSMLTFDGTSREVCISRRVRTNTPLQALVLLNDPVYMEAAAALAGRMLLRGSTEPEDRLRQGYLMAISRLPSDDELSELTGIYRLALEEYRQHPDEAGRLLAAFTEEPRFLHASGLQNRAEQIHEGDPELAALTIVASVLMNLDAFVMKE